MDRQTLIYSFVARAVILVEYTEFSGNFTSIASQCLEKLPASNNKFTYDCDSHTFNYLVENGFICIVAANSAGNCLSRAREASFKKRYEGGKAATVGANSLEKEFGPKLKEHIKYCVDHPVEIDNLAKARAQVLNRGEKIEILVDKTDNLRSHVSQGTAKAQDFRTQGTKMKRKMWIQNMKIKLIVLGVIVAVILIIILIVCHGFKC